MAEPAKLKLQSNDREMFEVDREVALKSETVKNMIDDVEPSAADQAIPLPNVSGKILAKVIEYCKYHVDAEKGPSPDKAVPTEDEKKAWDADFVKVDQATLFDLILVRTDTPGLAAGPAMHGGAELRCSPRALVPPKPWLLPQSLVALSFRYKQPAGVPRVYPAGQPLPSHVAVHCLRPDMPEGLAEQPSSAGPGVVPVGIKD